MTIFAQKPIYGGWVRYGIAEDYRGALVWSAVGGNFTAETFREHLPGVPVLLFAGGGDRVTLYDAERVSGVAWPVCQDWMRDRM